MRATGWWGRRVVPRLVERSCGVREVAGTRDAVCAGLAGEVVEIGFGSGHNVPHYPAAVSRVRAVEPADLAWRIAAERVAASPVVIERVGLDGGSVPLPDGCADAVLATWVLCTVPDPAAVLAEVRRLLRPGGTLHLAEHGAAPDAGVRRWQRRLEPLQRRLAGGCHLTREPLAMLADAGFEATEQEVGYVEGLPRLFGFTTRATARVT